MAAQVEPAASSTAANILKGAVDASQIDDSALARLPHNHSWRYSPHWATACSCLFFVLFFYQPYWLRVSVWSWARSLIEDERRFYVAGSFLVHLSVFLMANGGMALIYAAQMPCIEQYKIQDKPWPWMRSEEERDAYFALVRKTLLMIAFNYTVQLALLWFGYADAKKFGMEGSLETLPHWYTSLWQIAVCMIVEDTLFYCQPHARHPGLLWGAMRVQASFFFCLFSLCFSFSGGGRGASIPASSSHLRSRSQNPPPI